MAVFVRKLSNRKNIDSIRKAANVKDVQADAVTSEFKTKNNSLSVWRVVDKTAAEQGILAIALSSSHIETMDFVLFDEDSVNSNNLTAIHTFPAKNPYSDAAEMHFDISDMRLHSLSSICKMYKSIDDSCIIRKTKSDLKNLIIKANSEGLINSSDANDDVIKYLREFGIV
jgi:hypothetical protein